jgi:hypothetical protein
MYTAKVTIMGKDILKKTLFDEIKKSRLAYHKISMLKRQ